MNETIKIKKKKKEPKKVYSIRTEIKIQVNCKDKKYAFKLYFCLINRYLQIF